MTNSGSRSWLPAAAANPAAVARQMSPSMACIVFTTERQFVPPSGRPARKTKQFVVVPGRVPTVPVLYWKDRKGNRNAFSRRTQLAEIFKSQPRTGHTREPDPTNNALKHTTTRKTATHERNPDAPHVHTHTHTHTSRHTPSATPTRERTRQGNHRLRDLHRPLRRRLRPLPPLALLKSGCSFQI